MPPTNQLSAEYVSDDEDDVMDVTQELVDDDDLELEYQPPKDFVPEALAHTSAFDLDATLADNQELWLFRVPAEIPLNALDGLIMQLPGGTKKKKTSSSADPLGRITVKERNQQEEKYGVYDVTTTGGAGGEAGEMAELKCILPSKRMGRYAISTKTCTRFFNVTPVGDHPPTAEELQDAGEKVAAMPNERMVHPEGMKLQSLPFGFDTGGKSLELSLERYSDKLSTFASATTKVPSPATAAASETPAKRKKRKQDKDVTSTTPITESIKKRRKSTKAE
ncbi:hypothetical protein PhCBS80983_g01514 [Powellomyces hirtus]|uniref:Uncharacterized protein n=1 Tax=Powellomyces hirtus TaxID=109895 RepID=A0A507EAK4_9FUNG|nr:hypothetical protein PhCBS80983_g01514 [Powellomyces hirtus]